MNARHAETLAVLDEMQGLGIPVLPRLYVNGWTFEGPDEPVDQWKARMLAHAAKEPTP